MRFIGSLIKYFIYLCVILIAAGAALFWFDTGDWLVLPLARRAGNFFLDPLKLEIENINGSVRNGFALDGLKLISGDKDLLTLAHVDASPDWDLAMSGLDGMPFIKSLNVRGVSSDLDSVMALANHFATSEDKESKTKSDDVEQPLKIALNPFDLSIEDVNFGTPYANLELDALTLDKAGKLFLDSKIVSDENIFPFKTSALINFEPLEILSSDLALGSQGTGTLTAALEPLKANLNLTALSLDELLKFAPPMDIKASGRIDAKIFAKSEDNFLKVNGVVSMPKANVMEIPLNFRLPFDWDGEKLFSLTDATLNTEVARLNLNASADISNFNVLANGEARNISLTEIGTMFAPDLKLRGEGGNLDFDIDTNVKPAIDGNEDKIDEILSNTRADIKGELPLVSALGMKIVENLAAKIKLSPSDAPKIDATGRVFGGKLFARGEVNQELKPQAVVSIVNLDVPTLINTFPAVAKSIQKPSGKITLRTIIHENLNVDITANSEKLAAYGLALTNIKANGNFVTSDMTAELESLSANFGKGLITANGGANINTGDFSATARVENLEPRVIPELKQVMGAINLDANASGNYNDINGIKADALIKARGVGYDGMKIGNVDVPVTFANQIVNISNARANLPGGVVNVNGQYYVKNNNFNFAALTRGINLAETLKALKLQVKDMPVSGKISGTANAKGNFQNPSFNASLKAESVKAGALVDMPKANIEAKGNMKKIIVNKLSATVNGADINGSGAVAPNQKNFMNSAVDIEAKIKHLDLKKNLKAIIGSSPIDGVVDAVANVKGTLAKPEGELKLTRPIFYGKNQIDNVAAKLSSPEANHYKIHAGAKVANFRPEADIDVKEKGGIWSYRVDTKPLDINSAIETQMPSLAGIAKGYASVNVTGSTRANSNININATAKEIKIMDKISVKNVSLPVVFSQAKNKIEMKNGTANVSGGTVNSGLNVDLTKKNFDGKVKVSNLDFGELVTAFLPEGELIGKANAEVSMKGGFGVMPTSYAHGKFSTTPGYLHKMGIINKVTPTKKISFEKISGSFFWDGKDVFLNPGTGATAGKDEPLYRYVHVNGSLGVLGKGLNLLFDGRFDLKILDQLLGAMKGVFQYMTGGIAQNVLKDAAGRVLGIKRRDYQTVSFQLVNSWNNLGFSNLKVTKPIEDFLPIDLLNKDEEKQRDDTQFKLNLKIPVGQGDPSVEEESPGDQFKQQLIDNLFNIGF